jgi:hypothetical protein
MWGENMSTIEDFIKALKILSKYYPDGRESSYPFEAEHDTIFSHVTTDQLPDNTKDAFRLRELGWGIEDGDVWAYYT